MALTAQRAAEALRERGVARLLEGRPASSAEKPAPSPPTSAKPAPARSLSSAPHLAPSAGARPPAREQSDPDLDAIVGYSRVVSIALAELRAYLEFGAASLRSAALEEVEHLAHEQPHWAALRGLIVEAELVESDGALKSRLKALLTELGP